MTGVCDIWQFQSWAGSSWAQKEWNAGKRPEVGGDSGDGTETWGSLVRSIWFTNHWVISTIFSWKNLKREEMIVITRNMEISGSWGCKSLGPDDVLRRCKSLGLMRDQMMTLESAPGSHSLRANFLSPGWTGLYQPSASSGPAGFVGPLRLGKWACVGAVTGHSWFLDGSLLGQRCC